MSPAAHRVHVLRLTRLCFLVLRRFEDIHSYSNAEAFATVGQGDPTGVGPRTVCWAPAVKVTPFHECSDCCLLQTLV